MQLSVYVSAKTRSYAKVLFAIFTLVHLIGCLSFQSSSAQKKNEEVLESQLGIVVNYLEQGKPERAHVELRNLLKENPKNPKILNLMGLTNLAFGKPQIAETYFRKALDQDNDPRYVLNLSSAFIEAKKYGKAADLLKARLKAGTGEYPFPERFYHNLGFAYAKSNKLATARKYYSKALDINPAYYPTLLELGQTYRTSGDQQKAEHYFLQARDACINCYAPVRILVDARTQRGQTADAATLLKDFLQRKNLLAKDRNEATLLLSKIEPQAKSTK